MNKKTGMACAAALAAAPMAAVAVPAVQLPSFSCDAASGGGSINWGDGLALTPSSVVTGSVIDKGPELLAPLGCTDGSFDDTVKFTKGDKLTIDLAGLKDLGLKEDIKISSELKWSPGTDKFTFFDVYLESQSDLKSVGGGDLKVDFIGIKLDTVDSFLKLDAAQFNPDLKSWSFDFTEPSIIDKTTFDALGAGELSISLYSTPGDVPEPGTLGLLGTGLLGLALRFRRKDKP